LRKRKNVLPARSRKKILRDLAGPATRARFLAETRKKIPPLQLSLPLGCMRDALTASSVESCCYFHYRVCRFKVTPDCKSFGKLLLSQKTTDLNMASIEKQKQRKRLAASVVLAVLEERVEKRTWQQSG
jgi:hypothetical protein